MALAYPQGESEPTMVVSRPDDTPIDSQASYSRPSCAGLLTENEATSRAVLRFCPLCVFVHDLDGRILDVNRAGATQLGYSKDELLQLTVFDIYVIDREELEEERARMQWRGMRAGDELRMLCTHTRKDGSTYLADVRVTACQIKGRDLVLAYVADVTERQRIEEERVARMREAEEHARNIERKNIAMAELVGYAAAERERLERRIAANIADIILPLISAARLSKNQRLDAHLDLLERSLKGLVAFRMAKLDSFEFGLTRREIQVCELVRQGLSTKEIAGLLGISKRSVDTHRTRIRKKLGLPRSGAELAVFLQRL